MTKYDLSILIPARQEEFLSRTIKNILENIEGKTEIIAVLDGAWANPTIDQDPRVTILYHPKSVGQRAATKDAARLSSAKYIMKVDAHCAFDKGFDVKMMNLMEDDITMVPVLTNLHAFDWVCSQGHRRYQGPEGPCKECGKETTKDIIFQPRERTPHSTAFRFDTDMHFQYWNEYKLEQHGDFVETMTIQGSCYMMTREKYWELDIDSDEFNSWGQQGVEVACKTWLSGGRVMCNRTTWYAHLFRTQDGFKFPYDNPQSKIDENREKTKELFRDNKWGKAVHNFQWLLDKFNPPDWTIPTKGVVYITDNQLDPKLMKICQDQLRKAFNGTIATVSLKPLNFGDIRIVRDDLQREKLSIFKQILSGLEALDSSVVFLCDHDVLYHPSHFDFNPPRKDTFYYDLNWWRVRTTDGFSVHWDAKQSNLLCANRLLLIAEYKERIRKVEAEGWHKGGYEPGTRSLKRGGFSDSPSKTYMAAYPSLDLRHGKNLTADKWKKEDFRDPKYRVGWGERFDKSWKETWNIPEWEKVK